jgi:betaine-aldehyde dehydrogenase
VFGAFGNSGQVCAAIERAYVHESIYEKLLGLLIEKVQSLRLGVDIAPLVNRQLLEKVEDHVQDAKLKGAKVVVGGKISSEKKRGYWYLPTILTDVNAKMKVISEETFGPILPIVKYHNISEAINLANDSRYGLGASIWTSDLEKGRDIAKMLECGMVWINDVNIPFPQCPWGGMKFSGQGIELSDAGILEFIRLKHINTETSTENRRVYYFPY